MNIALNFDWFGFLALLGWCTLLAFFFAKVEIQIEGKDGWAASLPTWRINKHWLLNVFWGGRTLTGYHAWIFPFILFAGHLSFFIHGNWSWNLELRTLGTVTLFWIIEDYLWFVCNPAFGIKSFRPGNVQWHPHWFLGLPIDYWIMAPLGLAVIAWTFFS